MDKIKNVELNTAAQETTAIVAANNTLSTTVQQPAAPSPADTDAPIETTFVEKAQTPAAAPADEKKQEEGKKKKTRKVERCKVDIKKNAIVVTKEFAKRANVIGSAEFNRLSDLCRAYPNFKVIARTATSSTTRPSMKGLTKEFMEKHIQTLHNADWALYLRQQQISEAFKSPYMYIRKWFVERYPNWTEYVVQPDAAANA